MSRESGVQCSLPCSANAQSHDPGHGPSHRQARARPEPGTMALAQDFVSQSHKKPGQSHGFEPKPSQNITSWMSVSEAIGAYLSIKWVKNMGTSVLRIGGWIRRFLYCKPNGSQDPEKMT